LRDCVSFLFFAREIQMIFFTKKVKFNPFLSLFFATAARIENAEPTPADMDPTGEPLLLLSGFALSRALLLLLLPAINARLLLSQEDRSIACRKWRYRATPPCATVTDVPWAARFVRTTGKAWFRVLRNDRRRDWEPVAEPSPTLGHLALLCRCGVGGSDDEAIDACVAKGEFWWLRLGRVRTQKQRAVLCLTLLNNIIWFSFSHLKPHVPRSAPAVTCDTIVETTFKNSQPAANALWRC